jgi:hypothetical protein
MYVRTRRRGFFSTWIWCLHRSIDTYACIIARRFGSCSHRRLGTKSESLILRRAIARKQPSRPSRCLTHSSSLENSSACPNGKRVLMCRSFMLIQIPGRGGGWTQPTRGYILVTSSSMPSSIILVTMWCLVNRLRPPTTSKQDNRRWIRQPGE